MVDKRIAIVTDNIKRSLIGGVKYGGGYVVSQNLIFELAKMPSVEVTVFTEKGSFVNIENINVVEIPFSRKDSQFLGEIDRILTKENFDIVLSINVRKLFQNPLFQGHSFIHRTKNNCLLLSTIKKIFALKKITKQKKQIMELLKNNSRFVAVSNIIKEDYAKNFGIELEKIKVVYPGCKQIFPEYPIMTKESKISIGVVANSSINKSGHLLVFALGLVKLSGYDFNFKIISPKYQKDLLMKFLIKLFKMDDCIEVFAAQADMSNFYSKINLLVLPSMHEAFGLVALEAMSFGIPALVSQNAGVAEIIESNNGFKFNRGSLKDLISKLKLVIDCYKNDFESYRKISYNAYQTTKKFTWEKFTENLLEALS